MDGAAPISEAKTSQHNAQIGRANLPHKCTPKRTRTENPAYTTDHPVEEIMLPIIVYRTNAWKSVNTIHKLCVRLICESWCTGLHIVQPYVIHTTREVGWECSAERRRSLRTAQDGSCNWMHLGETQPPRQHTSEVNTTSRTSHRPTTSVQHQYVDTETLSYV